MVLSPNALLSLILAASMAVDAVSVGRRTGKAALGFSMRINTPGVLNFAELECARMAAILQGGSASGVGVTNNQVGYLAQVGIGSPLTNYTLIINTGSANTFVGANKTYVQTSTSINTGYYVMLTYTGGGWYGTEWNDTLTFGSGLVIKNQSIGMVSSATGFPPGIDGLLGVGPVNLTQDTVQGMTMVPTVLDNLCSQGMIWEEVLGIYFVPYAESQSQRNNGELTFGGYDESTTITPVTYVPLTKTYPLSLSWGIKELIWYGNETILLSTAGIVDSGTTLMLIATDVFEKYQSLTGGVMNDSTGLLSLTLSQYNGLQPLLFDIGDASFVMTLNMQIWLHALNTAISGSMNGIYLVVVDIGYVSGSGLDFINGYTFLEHFYSVYDTANQRVGFAQTEYTDSQSN